jgi:regulator of RNase E activity RraA
MALNWGQAEADQLAAIRESLAKVSTATAFQLCNQHGWRNTYMQGLLPIQSMGLGQRIVGRARTVRYLIRRGPELFPAGNARCANGRGKTGATRPRSR